MAKDPELHRAKSETIHNLEAIQANLNRCISEGMIDTDATYYNELVDLIDEASVCESWGELEELISQAKILEVDVAAWLAGHGQTSISLPWPKRPI